MYKKCQGHFLGSGEIYLGYLMTELSSAPRQSDRTLSMDRAIWNCKMERNTILNSYDTEKF